MSDIFVVRVAMGVDVNMATATMDNSSVFRDLVKFPYVGFHRFEDEFQLLCLLHRERKQLASHSCGYYFDKFALLHIELVLCVFFGRSHCSSTRSIRTRCG